MLCAHVQFTSECSDVAKQKINGIFVSTKFLRNKISITGITEQCNLRILYALDLV